MPVEIKRLEPAEAGNHYFEADLLYDQDFLQRTAVAGVLNDGFWQDVRGQLTVPKPGLNRLLPIHKAYFWPYVDEIHEFKAAQQNLGKGPHPRHNYPAD